MSKERNNAELEIGGFGLLAAALLVLGMCAASFWLGRWSVQAGVGVSANGRADEAVMKEEGDVGEALTFFDGLELAPELSVQGDERTELGSDAPGEEKPAPETAAPAPGSASPPLPAASGDGRFQIQVLASAERTAAEAVLARLQRRGYRAVVVEGEKDGRPIYRVRVGGYSDEASARRAADAIEEQEGLRTWIIR